MGSQVSMNKFIKLFLPFLISQQMFNFSEFRPNTDVTSIRGCPVENKIFVTKPATIQSKAGTSGNTLKLSANYFQLTKKPTWELYQYRVDFKPEIHLAPFRKYLVKTQKDLLGGYLFDGTQLFLCRKLDVQGDKFEKIVKGNSDDEYLMTFKYTRVVSMTDSASLQILNIILRRAMGGLNLQLIGRNFFDPKAKICIKEFNLELWPGYTTSIRQHENNILLCAEISHKVMRMETIYDIMNRLRKESREFKTAVASELLGTTVLTAFNNKTYRIDEIDYSMKPSDTFDTKNGPITFVQYYRDVSVVISGASFEFHQ